MNFYILSKCVSEASEVHVAEIMRAKRKIVVDIGNSLGKKYTDLEYAASIFLALPFPFFNLFFFT